MNYFIAGGYQHLFLLSDFLANESLIVFVYNIAEFCTKPLRFSTPQAPAAFKAVNRPYNKYCTLCSSPSVVYSSL